MTPLQEPSCNKTHGEKKWTSCPVCTTAARKVAEIKTCLGVQLLLNTHCSGWCSCSLCSILCQGVPCLAVFIRRLDIKALMLSICFEHIAGVNQLNAGSSAPCKIRRILIWHGNINSPVLHFQGCKATQEGGKQMTAESQRAAFCPQFSSSCRSVDLHLSSLICTSAKRMLRCFYSLSPETCDIWTAALCETELYKSPITEKLLAEFL